MASVQTEKKLLQRIVAILAIGPILAGLDGVLLGARMLGGGGGSFFGGGAFGGAGFSFGVDSQFRYLSGVLLAIGLAYLSTIPKIEHRRERFDIITVLIFAGGLARLAGLEFIGLHSLFTILILFMELIVAPALCVWQHRVANRMSEPDFLA